MTKSVAQPKAPNAQCRLEARATKPMNGGPIKIPA